MATATRKAMPTEKLATTTIFALLVTRLVKACVMPNSHANRRLAFHNEFFNVGGESVHVVFGRVPTAQETAVVRVDVRIKLPAALVESVNHCRRQADEYAIGLARKNQL